MITSFKLNTSELDISVIEAIRKIFKNKDIELTIRTVDEKTTYSKKILNAKKNVENNENIRSFTINEFAEFAENLENYSV